MTTLGHYCSTPSKLVVPTGAPIAAKATTAITAQFNLDARAPVAATAVPPTPFTQYGTTMNGFDAQGVPVLIKVYFIKTAADAWDVYDGDPAGVPTPGNNLGTLNFGSSGKLVPPATPLNVTLTSPNPNIGTFAATLDVSKATQYGTGFAISDLTQDGYTAGTLTGVSISEQGVITSRYSNGQSQSSGKIALADFRNVQGLKPVGQGNWVETSTPGQPINGSPGQGNFGAVNSGALEASNVDLTAQLVAMIAAQRDYQANAQTIKTQDTVLQTLVNLR